MSPRTTKKTHARSRSDRATVPVECDSGKLVAGPHLDHAPTATCAKQELNHQLTFSKDHRSTSEQRIHDFVVVRLADMLVSSFPDCIVHSNFGSMKTFGVGGEYPDVIVCLGPENFGPFHLYEVETTDSLNPKHSHQWSLYSSLGYAFTLVVSDGSRDATVELLVDLGEVHIDVLTYRILPGEQVVIG